MSFQPFIEKITQETGKTPDELAQITRENDMFEAGIKPGVLVDWLDKKFSLGQGKAIGLYGLFKHMELLPRSGKSKIQPSKSEDKPEV